MENSRLALKIEKSDSEVFDNRRLAPVFPLGEAPENLYALLILENWRLIAIVTLVAVVPMSIPRTDRPLVISFPRSGDVRQVRSGRGFGRGRLGDDVDGRDPHARGGHEGGMVGRGVCDDGVDRGEGRDGSERDLPELRPIG